MKKNEFIDKANEILSDILDKEINLAEDQPLSDIMDSLLMVNFINAIEHDLDVKFKLSQIKNFKTLGAVYNEYIAN